MRWIVAGPAHGSTVTLTDRSAWPAGATRQGKVIRKLASIEQDGRMARILVAVRDPLTAGRAGGGAPSLLLGDFVHAEITGTHLPRAFELDPGWVHEDDTAWVMGADDKLTVRKLDVAYRDGRRVIVTGGLSAGDRIVTSSLSVVTDGMPLRVDSEGAHTASEEDDHAG